MADPPLPGEQFPLGAQQFPRDALPEARDTVVQVLLHGRDRFAGCGDIEPSHRAGKGVHVEVLFEITSRLRERQQAEVAAGRTETTNPARWNPDRLHDFREELDHCDIPPLLSMRIEDEREAVEEPEPIRGLLGLRVEDRDPVLGRQESCEDSKLRWRANHESGTRPCVLEERADTCLK